jgi:hypothetical protein
MHSEYAEPYTEVHLFYGKKNGQQFYNKKRDEQRDWNRHIFNNNDNSDNSSGSSYKGAGGSVPVVLSKESSGDPLEKHPVRVERADTDVQRVLGFDRAGDEGNKKQYKKYFNRCKSYAGHSRGFGVLASC